MGIVDLAIHIYHENFPYVDGGLRKAIVAQIHTRMPAIIEDDGAWEEYTLNKSVLKAVHVYQCELRDDARSGAILTPPGTPAKGEQKGKPQARSSGA
jgi:histone acetyltransferase HTATIP